MTALEAPSPAIGETERPLRRAIAILLGAAFLFPVLMVVSFLPTPPDDLREHINIGLTFPLFTWKNPPLQSWVAGLVALTSLRDAWIYMLIAQVWNAIGLIYLVRIARDFVAPDAAAPLAIAYGGNLFVSAVILNSVLNADQLQGTLWIGVLFHLLAAVRDNRWRDWIACGVFAGLAILTKYTFFFFALSLGLAILLTPSHRVVLSRAGLYAAGLIAVAMAVPHVIAQHGHPSVFDYAITQSQTTAGTGGIRFALTGFAVALVATALPLGVLLLVLAARGEVSRRPYPRDGAARVVVLTAVIAFGMVLAAILFLRFRFVVRYGEPLAPIFLLGLFAVVLVRAEALRVLAYGILIALCAVFAFLIVVAQSYLGPLYIIRNQRDPADIAAMTMRAEWERRFPCGPAYILGRQYDAYAVGLYYGKGAIGVSPGDFTHGHWIDRGRLRDLGAIIVESPASVETSPFAAAFPDTAPPQRLSLPHRRWPGPEQHVYLYRFVPPENCPSR